MRINNRSVWLDRCDRISRAFYYVIDCGCGLARRNIVVEERQSCLDLLFDLTRLWDENETHRGEAAHAAGSEDRRGANSELKADLNPYPNSSATIYSTSIFGSSISVLSLTKSNPPARSRSPASVMLRCTTRCTSGANGVASTLVSIFCPARWAFRRPKRVSTAPKSIPIAARKSFPKICDYCKRDVESVRQVCRRLTFASIQSPER